MWHSATFSRGIVSPIRIGVFLTTLFTCFPARCGHAANASHRHALDVAVSSASCASLVQIATSLGRKKPWSSNGGGAAVASARPALQRQSQLLQIKQPQPWQPQMQQPLPSQRPRRSPPLPIQRLLPPDEQYMDEILDDLLEPNQRVSSSWYGRPSDNQNGSSDWGWLWSNNGNNDNSAWYWPWSGAPGTTASVAFTCMQSGNSNGGNVWYQGGSTQDNYLGNNYINRESCWSRCEANGRPGMCEWKQHTNECFIRVGASPMARPQWTPQNTHFFAKCAAQQALTCRQSGNSNGGNAWYQGGSAQNNYLGNGFTRRESCWNRCETNGRPGMCEWKQDTNECFIRIDASPMARPQWTPQNTHFFARCTNATVSGYTEGTISNAEYEDKVYYSEVAVAAACNADSTCLGYWQGIHGDAGLYVILRSGSRTWTKGNGHVLSVKVKATCSTYTMACPDGTINPSVAKGCGATCDETTCCEANLALQNLGSAGCTPSNKCSSCQGDCDSDSDCASGLTCFQRSSSVELVPGCSPGGFGDVDTHDYCFQGSTLALPTPRPMSTPTAETCSCDGCLFQGQCRDRANYPSANELSCVSSGGVWCEEVVISEPLTTLAQNNFNDRGDSHLYRSQTYTYTLGNGYTCELTGWTRTRNSAMGFIAHAGDGTAVVKGLQDGNLYRWVIYMTDRENSRFVGNIPVTVNGLFQGNANQYDATDVDPSTAPASLRGETTANAAGEITFLFTDPNGNLRPQLSGIAVGRKAAATTSTTTTWNGVWDWR